MLVDRDDLKEIPARGKKSDKVYERKMQRWGLMAHLEGLWDAVNESSKVDIEELDLFLDARNY